MKKMVFIFLILFLQVAFSNEGSSRTIKSILRNDDNAILLLDDNSFWKIYSAKEVSQTWTEWWYNIVPNNPEKIFVCDFSDWEFFSNVEVKPFETKNSIELEKFHNLDINSCSFVIKHERTGTFAFAKPLQVEEFLFMVSAYIEKMNRKLKEEFDRGYSYGYSTGYSFGYSAGYSAGSASHH